MHLVEVRSAGDDRGLNGASRGVYDLVGEVSCGDVLSTSPVPVARSKLGQWTCRRSERMDGSMLLLIACMCVSVSACVRSVCCTFSVLVVTLGTSLELVQYFKS